MVYADAGRVLAAPRLAFSRPIRICITRAPAYPYQVRAETAVTVASCTLGDGSPALCAAAADEPSGHVYAASLDGAVYALSAADGALGIVATAPGGES